MSVHDETFRQLCDMGIGAPLARAAAMRFTSADAAVNWCFGPGADWKPEDDHRPVPPPPPPRVQQGVTVQHREVADETDNDFTPSAPHHSPNAGQKHTPLHTGLSSTFASNNPFRDDTWAPSSASMSRDAGESLPGYSEGQQSNPIKVDDDDDEELRRALEMSKEETGNDDQRHERERSVRARGVPPPSPQGEHVEKGVTLFGPSQKEDKDGSMALVPSAAQNNTTTEDDDLNRAIADSLMTASFHSASAAQDVEKPVPSIREEGAPLVLYSQSGHSTYAANLLQGLLAVPQFREAARAMTLDSSLDSKMFMKGTYVQELVERSEKDLDSFVEVDQTLKELRDGNEPNQLPPGRVALELQDMMAQLISEIRLKNQVMNTAGQPVGDKRDDPRTLFVSRINSETPINASYVRFSRQADGAKDVLGALAHILWTQNSSNSSIECLGDILTVEISWEYGAPRELWKIDERLVLDRFLTENQRRAAQTRANQHVAAANVRRVTNKVREVTTFRGQDTLESISTLIRHYETSPLRESEDPNGEQKAAREQIKAKLENILESLRKKKQEYEAELVEQEYLASSSAFETEDPELNRHVYTLRAVLYHDGALVAGQHLYAYVCQADGTWWKIQDHEAKQVEFETIAGDRTGLFMDGGPYLMLYSREGPRPEPRVKATPEEVSEQDTSSTTSEADLIDLDPTPPPYEAGEAGEEAPREKETPKPAKGGLIEVDPMPEVMPATGRQADLEDLLGGSGPRRSGLNEPPSVEAPKEEVVAAKETAAPTNKASDGDADILMQ